MTDESQLRPFLTSLNENHIDLFKRKVSELLELAKNIPKDDLPEAENYFTQHCNSLREILHIRQERVSLIESSSGMKYVLLNSTGDILSGNNGKIKTPEDQLDICKTVKQNEATNTEEKDLFSVAKNSSCSNSFEDTETNAENNSQIEEYSVQGEVIREAVAMSSSDNCALKFASSAKCGGNFQKTKSFSEPLEELVDRAVNQGKKCQGFLVKENIEGQDSVCDIAKLLECIPELSHSMGIDRRNVTVLKDSGDKSENCLHLSVELDDGTVQEFQIASYIHDTNRETEDVISKDNTSISVQQLDQENNSNQSQFGNNHEAGEHGPTIMARRLRERKKKLEVKQRGPGRPKNENIPAPEVNEKGEAFYRCKECDSTVKTYNALIVHMRTHTGSRPFQCPVCSKSFTTKGNMKAHELTTHSDHKPWKCEYCNKCFKEKKVLKIHERIHTGEKPYSCSVCERAFSQRSVMIEHMLVHSNNKPHLCDFCGQGFRGASSLKAHKKRHLGLREYQCDTCDKAFVCRNELKRHLLTHNGERPYSCEFCSKAFTRLSYLKEHLNLHTGEKPFTCFECGISFSDTMSLHRHKKKHKIEKENENMLTQNETVSLVNTYSENIQSSNMEGDLTLEIPEEMTINGGQTSIQVVVDENTSVEDFQKLHSLLLSAASNAELMMNSQEPSKQLYKVLCVNPDTQEAVGQVEGQEVIVEGQSEDINSVSLQYGVH